LFILGCAIGIMLTASVNVVQSSFGEAEQGEISGVSRSVSNLGSSLGTAIVGSVLVAFPGDGGYAAGLIVIAAVGTVGFLVALALPAQHAEAEEARPQRSPPGAQPHAAIR
jgi:predicted MFS family arabinose efflux permease